MTVDVGVEDAAVRAQEGPESLRRGRVLRLTEEALEQGGVLSQEDLARALDVDRRTIVRDIKVLKAEGHLVTRANGNLATRFFARSARSE